MSNALITTSSYQFLRQNHDGHVRKGSLCSVKKDQSDLSSSQNDEKCLVNEDPSRINYFETGTIPSTTISPSSSSSSSSSSGTDQYDIPETQQQLVIDFTPVDGVDDDEVVVKKCNDFWDFVENNPKLNGFCVMPESTYPSSVDNEESMDSNEEADLANYPALCIMKNKQNLLDDTFMTKAETVCEPLPGDYCFGPAPTPLRRKTVDKRLSRKCDSIVGKRNLTDGAKRIIDQFRVPDPAAVDVLKLCQEMKDWDLTIPKKLVSPRPASSLIDAVMQRKP